MTRTADRIRSLCALLLLPAPALWAQLGDEASTEPSAAQDRGGIPLPGTAPSPALLGSTRDALMRAGDFAGALAPAEDVVAVLDENDPQLPPQLLALALIQTEVGSYELAQQNYLRAIDLIEERDGESSITLAEPYHALARSYIKSDKFGEAVSALQAARQITQRNLGLFSLEQMTLLDDMTVAYLGAGNTLLAKETQEARLATALRHFGADTEEVVPYHYELANYYDRSRLRQLAREQYEAVLAIEKTTESHAEELLRPLRELVRVDLLTGENSGAQRELEQVLADETDLSAAERARALVALGDWEMVRNSISLGIGYYQQAQAAYYRDPDANATFMDQPSLIDFVPPLSPVDRRSRERPYSWGTIELAFNVSADAQISDVHVVSANPSGVMEEAYVKRLLETHARPRLADGMPLPTSDVRLSHYFRYYVKQED